MRSGRGHRNGAGLIALVGAVALGDAATAQHDGPETLVLTGIVRDFKARELPGGHTDFQWQPRNKDNKGAFGHYMNIVADRLDTDGKPVFRSPGHRVTSQWRDGAGRNIMSPREYLDSRPGDVSGAMETQGNAVNSAQSFSQWFREQPGVNISKTMQITLRRDPDSGHYVFDDRTDPQFSNLGGFFPINGDLYGNYGSTGKNYHFTFELGTQFVYRRNAGQVFTFRGDDDVWVFVDGWLVIDLGGVHGAIEQTIDLDRLGWLVDGNTYQLRFFFAERHTTEANFRITTSLELRDIAIPVSAALYD
ncbi:MAG TPA: fibro-slime domain-containing protein [Phycisphaerales bacterium]|nr:fibro-slime domain-containing protein [Phycisphaerales bacterium]